MAEHTGLVLSKLDRIHLRRILALFINHTGMHTKEGAFRYSAEDIRRRMSFGGDFSYTFGDFFKLEFLRYGIKRNEKDPDTYDTIIHLDVRLDNTNGLRKDDKLYITRVRIAEETNEKIQGYLRESGLGVPIK
jgi:hypothetical protein